MVYPLGSILVVRSMAGKNKQAFLEGHTADIACVAMTPDGSRIVSGQVGVFLGLVERKAMRLSWTGVQYEERLSPLGSITSTIDEGTTVYWCQNVTSAAG